MKGERYHVRSYRLRFKANNEGGKRGRIGQQGEVIKWFLSKFGAAFAMEWIRF